MPLAFEQFRYPNLNAEKLLRSRSGSFRASHFFTLYLKKNIKTLDNLKYNHYDDKCKQKAKGKPYAITISNKFREQSRRLFQQKNPCSAHFKRLPQGNN
ncbi:hypothetical protein [Moorena producens]|uniref:hypothetical protein n=1 Tax=Moorena producens TaxID=1155739 RepID=UPI003C783BDA